MRKKRIQYKYTPELKEQAYAEKLTKNRESLAKKRMVVLEARFKAHDPDVARCACGKLYSTVVNFKPRTSAEPINKRSHCIRCPLLDGDAPKYRLRKVWSKTKQCFVERKEKISG